jgi:hypothetical protein
MDIVGKRADQKMIRIYARRVVAAMPHDFPVNGGQGNASVLAIRDSVGQFTLALYGQPTIAIRSSCAGPLNARANSGIDAGCRIDRSHRRISYIDRVVVSGIEVLVAPLCRASGNPKNYESPQQRPKSPTYWFPVPGTTACSYYRQLFSTSQAKSRESEGSKRGQVNR